MGPWAEGKRICVSAGEAGQRVVSSAVGTRPAERAEQADLTSRTDALTEPVKKDETVERHAAKQARSKMWILAWALEQRGAKRSIPRWAAVFARRRVWAGPEESLHHYDLQ